MSEMRKLIAEEVSKRRQQLNMEQKDVSDYAGSSLGTISKLENGKANISIDNLEKILDTLGLEIVIRIKQTEQSNR